MLDVNAPPFYPSLGWKTKLTDDLIQKRPHSPGSRGFVILDEVFAHEIPDEELFDTNLYPFTQTDLHEIEAVEEMNEMLAELEMMDIQEELHRKLMEKRHEKRSKSEDALMWNILTMSAKLEDTKQKAMKNKHQLHQKNLKKPMNNRCLMQPRYAN